MTTVVAGVLEREGTILICRRTEEQPHPLKWEFPGGKVEAGESPEQALVRELREELAIEAKPGAEIMRYEFVYPDKKPILLIFFAVTEWRGEMVWERREGLRGRDFLEGDEPFLLTLVEGAGKVQVDQIE